MELKDFLASVHAEVAEEMEARADVDDGAVPFAELVFTEIFAQHMFERGMTFEPHACRFAATVQEGELRLSGYALSDDMDKLDLFVAVYNGGGTPGVITELEGAAAAEHCGRFLILSAMANLAERVDETNDAYPLITTIASAWSQIGDVRIHVLTDLCAGPMQLPDIAIGDKTVTVEVVDIERVFDERQDVELQNRFRMLATFQNEWVVAVRTASTIAGETPESAFVDDAGARLADAEEISDFQRCIFERDDAGAGLLKVDGYALDDADGSLSLIISDFAGSVELFALSVNAAGLHFAAVERFATAALAGRLTTDGGRGGDAGIGLAADIVRLRPSITRLRLYLVSDRLFEGEGTIEGSTIDGLSVERQVWDAARFHKAAMSESGRDDLEVDFCTSDGKGIPALHAGSADGEYEGYLCTIPGDLLAAIYERHGSRLLEGNVRSFLSTKGKINSGIQTTLATRPEMFFAYNNGIAATAEAVVFEEDSSRITRAVNFQIVNGGQTTASLAAAFREGVDLSGVRVQMKMSVLSPSHAGELIPLIARFANSQNKVNESDFFANHPYHHRLEQLSRRVSAPAAGDSSHATHWYYERSRGQYVNEQRSLTAEGKRAFLAENPKAQLLTKLDVAKLENSWKGLPHKVSNGAQKNFVFFAGWMAKKWAEGDTGFDEHYFKNLVAMAILFRHTELVVKEQPWYQGAYRPNIVTFTLAVLQFTVLKSGKGRHLDLDSIWSAQAVPESLGEQLAEISGAVFRVLTNPSRGKANVTEWAKTEACWERAREAAVPLSAAVLDDLIDPIAKRYTEGGSLHQVGYGVFARTAVLGVQPNQWEQLRTWGMQNGLVDAKDAALLRTAGRLPKFVPSVKDCERIWSARSRLIKQGFGASQTPENK